MSTTIKHCDHTRVVFMTNNETGEQSDPYSYDILSNPGMNFPDGWENTYLYSMVQYYRDAVINRLSNRESFND